MPPKTGKKQPAKSKKQAPEPGNLGEPSSSLRTDKTMTTTSHPTPDFRKTDRSTIRPDPTPQGGNSAVEDWEQSDVTNIYNDIAVHAYLEKWRVNLEGRKRFQKIWVRGSKGGKTTSKKYDPAADAPEDTDGATTSLAPYPEELRHSVDTVEMVVVGLIDPHNPFQYHPAGTGHSKQKAIDRKARGILKLPSQVYRAVVPVTDYIKKEHIKYFVAVKPVSGVCQMRYIDGKAIFFFDEIWDKIDNYENITQKQRNTALGTTCRMAVALEKTAEAEDKVEVVDEDNWTPSNFLQVSICHNLANKLLTQWTCYLETRNEVFVETMQTITASSCPELKNKAPTGRAGIDAFYNQDVALSTTMAQAMIAELQSYYPSFQAPEVRHVQLVHAELKSQQRISEIPQKTLPFFFETLRWYKLDQYGSEALTRLVDELVRVSLIHERYRSSTV